MNHRLQDSEEGTRLLATCLKALRKGQVSGRSLAILNTRLHGNQSILMQHIHPNSVWLSSTNEKVDVLNDELYCHTVKDATVFKYRCVATYVPNLGNAFPTPDEIVALHDLPCSVREKRNSFASYIDLAIGCRVRCLKNMGTQIGVFNGAIGTVVGFCFERLRPDVCMPLVKDFKYHGNREIPVVLVRMDQLSLCGTDMLPFAA